MTYLHPDEAWKWLEQTAAMANSEHKEYRVNWTHRQHMSEADFKVAAIQWMGLVSDSELRDIIRLVDLERAKYGYKGHEDAQDR